LAFTSPQWFQFQFLIWPVGILNLVGGLFLRFIHVIPVGSDQELRSELRVNGLFIFIQYRKEENYISKSIDSSKNRFIFVGLI